MQRQTIILLRHGTIAPDNARQLIGSLDIPLSAQGIVQAQSWQSAFAGIPFDLIACSDLSRARKTAEIIAKSASMPVTVLPQLREINLGLWEGLTPDEIRKRFPGAWEQRGRDLANHRPLGGESFADLAERVLPAFTTLVGCGHRRMLAVTHAGVIRTIIASILSMPLAQLMKISVRYGHGAMQTCSSGGFMLGGLNIPPEGFTGMLRSQIGHSLQEL